MDMDLLKKIRDATELTNYSISKGLREIGVDITTQGLDHYDKSGSRSMRLDVLYGLFKLCQKNGVNEKQFMQWLGREFGQVK